MPENFPNYVRYMQIIGDLNQSIAWIAFAGLVASLVFVGVYFKWPKLFAELRRIGLIVFLIMFVGAALSSLLR